MLSETSVDITFVEGPGWVGISSVIDDDLTVKCSIGGNKLKIHVCLEYAITSKQFELVSLRKFFKTFKQDTIEGICRKIFDALAGHVGNLHVTVTGKSRNHPDCRVSMK